MSDLPLWLWFVLAALLVLVVLTALWCSWTAGRLDRMHLRVEAAMASLDAQLLRRASISGELATGGLTDPASALALLEAARAARESSGADRWLAQSELTAVLHEVELPLLVEEPLMAELGAACRKVAIGRRIHNDLVTTAIALHQRRRVRWFHLAGHASAPTTVDFDDRSDVDGALP